MRKPKLIEKVSREVTPELADSDNDEKESKYNAVGVVQPRTPMLPAQCMPAVSPIRTACSMVLC